MENHFEEKIVTLRNHYSLYGRNKKKMKNNKIFFLRFSKNEINVLCKIIKRIYYIIVKVLSLYCIFCMRLYRLFLAIIKCNRGKLDLHIGPKSTPTTAGVGAPIIGLVGNRYGMSHQPEIRRWGLVYFIYMVLSQKNF